MGRKTHFSPNRLRLDTVSAALHKKMTANTCLSTDTNAGCVYSSSPLSSRNTLSRLSPGRGRSLHARPRQDGDHAGVLPGEEQEDSRDRRHQRDPQNAPRLHRNPRPGEGSGAVSSAHKVALLGRRPTFRRKIRAGFMAQQTFNYLPIQ